MMKKDKDQAESKMRAEYDFASMKGGVRGKYFTQYRAGTHIVIRDPAAAQPFPGDATVDARTRAASPRTGENKKRSPG